jgi:extradiol dioxygenase family protein
VRLLHFRSLEQCDEAERILTGVVDVTSLPGGVLAVPDDQYDQLAETLEAAGVDWRWEPVEGFIGGRAIDEERA